MGVVSSPVIRRFSNFHGHRPADRLLRARNVVGLLVQRRTFVGMAARVIGRNILKLRYWVAGGAIGGGVALGNRYEEWKKNLPDLGWIKTSSKSHLEQLKERWDAVDWSPSDHLRLDEWSNRLAAIGDWLKTARDPNNDPKDGDRDDADASTAFFLGKSDAKGDEADSDSMVQMTEKERMQKLQEEMLQTQSKYQRELERLEKENKQLRTQLLLKDQTTLKRARKMKRSLIDMYSEALDLLTDYDSSYSTADNLPRVVVVGDQSAGKTSVLEMVAQARIFPRGSGEMMTRAPVKVTLSEGPYHTAQFKDSTREFDLNKESELRDLRKEIDIRMRNSVANGKTVSNEVIALTVKGPGLPRMVLVDLPGVISTVTADMAKDTKDEIVKMCRQYMENPNAIILCIQDGSVDAERSNVTDLVSSIDPPGKRTILVLTKVDLAEKNFSNPDRIKKILEGRLFPMKALGYYAVVTGKGSAQDSIESIRKYEEEFFSASKLFRDGILKPTQMTTRNMSLAVSDCFWRMVKDSVEAQADAFRATRFNLETEWKNNFPRLRELDRDELFDKAKGEILDEIVNLSQVNAHQWESALENKMWDKVANNVFDQIYMPAALVESAGTFNTLIDIKLKHWADKELASTSVQVGWETLSELFQKQVETDAKRSDHDALFDGLKSAVLAAAMERHKWDDKALDYLRVIQLNALDDRVVPDKYSWDQALKFMQEVVRKRLELTKSQLSEAKGPGTWDSWVRWKKSTEDHRIAQALDTELRALIASDPDHPQSLKDDDFTVVRRNLETKGVSHVPTETIRLVWKLVYKQHFLERAMQSTHECKNFFYHYKKGFNESDVDCQAVVLFWRVQKMLNLTSTALRQQITNTEQRRLEKEIKEVLEDWSQEKEKKKALLVGRRVELAEELKTVRHIQEKLDEFVTSLNHEKS
uniref:Dynamin-like GTPase OPA1, mitochondrial n=1 Tax=Plectus sambesii TaxID=2011161 RepID=A0A914VQK9_9BILA